MSDVTAVVVEGSAGEAPVEETATEASKTVAEAATDVAEVTADASVEIARIEAARDTDIAETVTDAATEQTQIVHDGELEQCRSTISTLETSLASQTSRADAAETRAQIAEAECQRLTLLLPASDPTQTSLEEHVERDRVVNPQENQNEARPEPARRKALARWI